MTEWISSLGKAPAEIRALATAEATHDRVCLRVVILGFQELVDTYGHTVRLDLPGSICGALRESLGCLYAEVLRTEHLADATVIAVFEDDLAADGATTVLSHRTFQLDRLMLPCPRLGVARGSLDQVLARDDDPTSVGTGS